MSALNQQQRYAAHKLMSALPLLAAAKADISHCNLIQTNAGVLVFTIRMDADAIQRNHQDHAGGGGSHRT